MALRFYAIGRYFFVFIMVIVFLAAFIEFDGRLQTFLIGITLPILELIRFIKFRFKFNNEIKQVINQKIIRKVYALHRSVGYFGETSDYLFFTPSSVFKKTILINKEYITGWQIDTVGTGVFGHSHNVSVEQKNLILKLNITTPNGEIHTMDIEISDLKKVKKMLKLPQFIDVENDYVNKFL